MAKLITVIVLTVAFLIISVTDTAAKLKNNHQDDNK